MRIEESESPKLGKVRKMLLEPEPEQVRKKEVKVQKAAKGKKQAKTGS